MRIILALPPLLALLLAACGTPVVKPEAMDLELLARTPGSGALVHPLDEEEHVVDPTPAWMAGVDPGSALTFCGWRADPGGTGVEFCLLLQCDPARDRLVMLPLEAGASPLEALADPARVLRLRNLVLDHAAGKAVRGARAVALSDAVQYGRLAPPLPEPRNIFAVAANFPSHLVNDLACSDAPELRAELSRGRPRVFRKHPAVSAGGRILRSGSPWKGYVGPFDPIGYPETITLPPSADRKRGTGIGVDTRVDYEVEVGFVLGRALTEEQAAMLSDEQLWERVAGLVLVSDTKARNPQMVLKVARRDREPDAAGAPFTFAEDSLNDALGGWDRTVYDWWSHAASFGDYAAVGPFFVATPGIGRLEPRTVITARTYADQEARGGPVPPDVEPGRFYLRQCSLVTDDASRPDALFWSVPAVLRAILAGDDFDRFDGGERRLEPGDIVSLGTPGGVVITARSAAFFGFVSSFLSTFTPLDWHDVFFGDDAPLYLNQGDELLFWAEGLGYQRHVLRRVDAEAPESRP